MLYNVRPSPELEITPLQREDLFLVQARGSGQAEGASTPSITLKALAQLPLVIPSRPNAIRMQVESEMANIGCRPSIALEIDAHGTCGRSFTDHEVKRIVFHGAVEHFLDGSV